MAAFKCPYNTCGKLVEHPAVAKEYFCPGCGCCVVSCKACGLGNKIGASYCRGCGYKFVFNDACYYSQKAGNNKNCRLSIDCAPMINQLELAEKYYYSANDQELLFSGSIAAGYGHLFFITRGTSNSQIYLNIINKKNSNFKKLIVTGLKSSGFIEIILFNGAIFLHDHEKKSLLKLFWDVTKLNDDLEDISYERICNINNNEFILSSNIIVTNNFVISGFYNKSANKSIIIRIEINRENIYKILSFNENSAKFKDYNSDEISESSFIDGEINNILLDNSGCKINLLYFTALDHTKRNDSKNNSGSFLTILSFDINLENLSKIKCNEIISENEIQLANILCYSEEHTKVLAWCDNNFVKRLFITARGNVTLKEEVIKKANKIFSSGIIFFKGSNTPDYIFYVDEHIKFHQLNNIANNVWDSCFKQFEENEACFSGSDPRVISYNNGLMICGNNIIYYFYIDPASGSGECKRINCDAELKSCIYYDGTIFAFANNFWTGYKIMSTDNNPMAAKIIDGAFYKLSKFGFYEKESNDNKFNVRSKPNDAEYPISQTFANEEDERQEENEEEIMSASDYESSESNISNKNENNDDINNPRQVNISTFTHRSIAVKKEEEEIMSASDYESCENDIVVKTENKKYDNDNESRQGDKEMFAHQNLPEEPEFKKFNNSEFITQSPSEESQFKKFNNSEFIKQPLSLPEELEVKKHNNFESVMRKAKDHIFCGECGTKIINPENHGFCQKCGKKIELD